MEMETAQFLQERGERIRLLREKQERELLQFDEESVRLGFRFVLYTFKHFLYIVMTTECGDNYNYVLISSSLPLSQLFGIGHHCPANVILSPLLSLCTSEMGQTASVLLKTFHTILYCLST